MASQPPTNTKMTASPGTSNAITPTAKTNTATTNDRAQLLAAFFVDRRLAHRELFRHRHKNTTAEFHDRIIDGFHDRVQYRCTIAFRGSAKSTIAEEGLCLQVGFREFHTGLILGASLPLACQRLHSIRREIEKNTRLKAVFGDLRGQPWTEDKLEFSNGVSITAMGKGQALRGSKDEIFRPDFVLADDIEDRESVRTPEGRDKIQSWFLGEVLPAMDPQGRCRILSNIIDPECLAEKLKAPDSGFVVESYPWEHKDPFTGERRATWPDRFPLEAIDTKRKQMFSVGRAREYMGEYMCVAVSDHEKTFKQDMKRVEPRIRLWEAVYAMYDPARTTGDKSATTGRAVWSWIGPRLIVWDLWAKKMMPDEIVNDILECDTKYNPVKIGFEKDGLDEWAMQPLRTEQVKRGIILPLVPVKAPTGKLDFIRALQIYFRSHEVWFTGDFAEAWLQFIGFPTGNIDAPNALAYALHPALKPGIAFYEDFNVTNIVDGMSVNHQSDAWLALNSNGTLTVGALIQSVRGGMQVLMDWVREGEIEDVLREIIREAKLESGRNPRCVAGPLHFDRYNNVGLLAAARRIPIELRRGLDVDRGRSEIRSILRRQTRGMPALLVSSKARWTLNAFSGGYARAVLKGGLVSEIAEEGTYRLLMEGIESFAGLLQIEATDDENSDRLNATTADGRRFFSVIPQRR